MRIRRLIPMRLIGAVAAMSSAACSTSAPHHSANDADVAARISTGMQRLGASSARGDCYANRIARTLSDADRNEAARIVERSKSKREMRKGVLSASAPVRRAFIGAKFGCSLAG